MPVPPDIYKTDVDFTSLALRYPGFAKKLKTNRQLDFSDPESVRQLTDALLDRDFNLKIDLPDDRLCPPVPNRFNYVLFAQKLLDSTQETYSDTHDPGRRVIGLDIGTGASAIYPLVACRQYSSWLFLGTEIDAKSRSFAARNIKNNDLDSRIKIIDTDSESKLLVPSDELERFQKIDVLITNPPFYASAEELEALAKQKSRPPNSACTGAPVEMIYPGGEVEFVTQLVQESTIAPNRTMIQWFSSMFGKLGSVNTVIERLREKGCTNYAVTEFVQGQRTRRWCVAWTWSGLRPSNAIARGTDAVEKKYLPFPTELDITVDSPINEVTETIRHEVSALHEVQWKWNADTRTGMGRSMTGDVWSRKARRRLQKQAVEQDSMEVDIPQPKAHPGSSKTSGGGAHATESEPEDDPQFVFRISVNTVHDEASEDKATNRGVTVNIRWLRGHDSTIFESFHGWLNRKLQD